MRILSGLVLGLAVLMQVGCMSSAIKKAELPALSPEAQERFDNVTPEAAIAEAESKIGAAQEAEMAFYSPQYLKRAEAALEEARKQSTNKEAVEGAVFVNILALESALESAENTKAAVQSQMGEVFRLRDALDKILADQYKKRTYNKLMSRMHDLISHVEAERQDKFDAQLPTLIEDMTQYETDTIVHNTLNPAELAMEEAEDVDADDLAPKSFEKAENTYKRSEEGIRANPHDTENVLRLGKEALVEARHAFFVAKRVEALQEVKKDKLENVVLDEERHLGRVADALSIKHIHDRSLHDQSVALADAVAELVKAGKEEEQPVQESSTDEEQSDAVAESEEPAVEEASADFHDLSEEIAAE